MGENGEGLITASLNHKISPILEKVISSDLSFHIDKILSDLTPREREIIKLRFGVGEQYDHTLEEIGEKLKLSRERIRQIIEEGLHKLGSSKNSLKLKELIED